MIFYAGEPQWVMGQVDVVTDRDTHRGVRYRPETFCALIGFESGVRGMLSFGQRREGSHQPPGFIRLSGTKGEIRAAMHDQSFILTRESGVLQPVEAEGYGWVLGMPSRR